MMVFVKWAVKDGCLWVWLLGKKDSGDVEVTRETLRAQLLFVTHTSVSECSLK